MFKKFIKLGRIRLNTMQKKVLRKEHPLRYLFWEATLNCNFCCKHCGSSAGENFYKNELSKEEMKRFYKELSEDFNPEDVMLAVTGGEPLLRQDLFEIMGYATSLGFNWGLMTNGFLINEEKIEKMKESGLKTLSMSIDGIGDIHDEFRNKKGAYKKAMNSIKLLVESTFLENLQVTTVIHKKNFDSLEEMYKHFSATGIDSWRVVNMEPIGRGDTNKEWCLSDDQLRKMFEFIKIKRKEARKNNFDVTYDCSGFLGANYEAELRDWYFFCATGITVASILHNGDIFVCPNVRRKKEFIQGNVRKDKFSNVWNKKFEIFRKENRTSCKDCLACKWWDDCLGGSFHLWDFDNNCPKICHAKILETKDKLLK